ncbi:MAG: hypothetical protein HC882_09490 [Acidobacteria bacterium]|nr:hypothetical protein [Acidobacteriota bacterium]
MRAQPPLEAQDVPWLERWLHRGFAQRRKTLASNLPALKTPVREWLVQHGHPEDLRAEALPPQDWLELARSLDALDASDAAPRASKDRPS